MDEKTRLFYLATGIEDYRNELEEALIITKYRIPEKEGNPCGG
jgi:hypothetical protein